MYNFNFLENEKLIDIFDNTLIKQGNNEKITTIALTDKRLLFLDYININDGIEAIRISRGVHYTRYKEVYYQIDLNDIESLSENEYFNITLKDKTIIEFNNEKLYKLLKNNSKRKNNDFYSIINNIFTYRLV